MKKAVISMPKILPKDLTSYDFLKAIAILLMVVDHFGYHFYPDDTWFRIFGRLCVPIWFFLIGYAKTREIPYKIWIWAGVLVVSAMVAGQYLLPLNILFTLMLTRLWIDGIMARALRTRETLAGMFFLLFFLSYLSGFVIEYGTLGMLFAMFGFMVRHKDELEIKRPPFILFTLASTMVFIVGQSLLLPSVTGAQFAVLSLGSVFICALLFMFEPVTFPKLTKSLPRPISGLFRLLGRRTLEIYVLHILLFRGIAMALYPERFGFYDWTFLPPGQGEFFMRILF